MARKYLMLLGFRRDQRTKVPKKHIKKMLYFGRPFLTIGFIPSLQHVVLITRN